MIGVAESKDGMARMLRDKLVIGKEYSLSELASLIGQQPNALRGKGVITKSGSDFQFFMVTLEKDQWNTQGYVDHLDEHNNLFWSGQNRQKAAETKLRDGTHDTFIFIQQKRRIPYKYYGRAVPLRTYYVWEPGTPSHVVFDLPEYKDYIFKKNNKEIDYFDTTQEILRSQPIPYSDSRKPLVTDKEILTTIRTAQGKYRKSVLDLWGTCSVTGVDEQGWLIASHIKPWHESSAQEKTDPKNSLLLTPNFDKLFDRGVISFSPDNGSIILPEVQTKQMWRNFDKMNIDDTIKLRYVPDGVGEYLEYHNQYVYGFTPNDGINTDDYVENLLIKGLA